MLFTAVKRGDRVPPKRGADVLRFSSSGLYGDDAHIKDRHPEAGCPSRAPRWSLVFSTENRFDFPSFVHVFRCTAAPLYLTHTFAVHSKTR